MILTLISDTHGKHRYFAIPDGDVLIHAGDTHFVNASLLNEAYKPTNEPIVVQLMDR